MKVGILTHYNVINNGATLQMYALKNWLESKGHEVFILTYKKNFDFSEEASKKYNLSLKNIFYIFNNYFFKGSPGLFFHKLKKQCVYKKFIKENFKFLPYESNLDAVVIGSDEVFSLEVGCNKMMYGHGLNTNKIIAYAPSFGQTDVERIDKFNCRDVISSGLKTFTSVSARDKFTAETIKKVSGINPTLVCDPVILFNFENVHTSVKLPKNKYILLYSYDKNMNKPEEIFAIKQYAKEKGLIIVSAGTYHKWCDKNIVCDPLKWIEYFRNAEEVITDTFHGAVLSIINKKKAAYFIRSINSRKLNALIEDFGLEQFIIKEMNADNIKNVMANNYSPEQVNKLILKYREIGEQYLLKGLSNNER